jgi:hypothetical protein
VNPIIANIDKGKDNSIRMRLRACDDSDEAPAVSTLINFHANANQVMVDVFSAQLEYQKNGAYREKSPSVSSQM